MSPYKPDLRPPFLKNKPPLLQSTKGLMMAIIMIHLMISNSKQVAFIYTAQGPYNPG